MKLGLEVKEKSGIERISREKKQNQVWEIKNSDRFHMLSSVSTWNLVDNTDSQERESEVWALASEIHPLEVDIAHSTLCLLIIIFPMDLVHLA